MRHDVSAELLALEELLLTNAARTSAQKLADLIAPDFVEIGSSGKKYFFRPGDTFPPLAEEAKIEDFSVRQIAENIYLVLYEIRYDSGVSRKITLRSSLWRKAADGWKIFFHQGTLKP